MDVRTSTPATTRIDLSGALIGVTNCTNRIVGRASRLSGPLIGTPANTWVIGNKWSTGFSSIMQAISAAADHGRGFAWLLRAVEDHGPSFAALCRAFLEAAGRAWWLLDSKDAAQLENRAAAMRVTEIRESGDSGVTVRVRDGKYETVSHAEALLDAERALSLASVAGRKEKTPNYSTLAHRVMSAAGVTDPRGKYSHLSAVSHGAGYSVGGLGARTDHEADGFTHFTISLPIANAQMYLHVILRVLNLLMKRFVTLACDATELARWHQTYVNSYNRMVYAFDSLSRD